MCCQELVDLLFFFSAFTLLSRAGYVTLMDMDAHVHQDKRVEDTRYLKYDRNKSIIHYTGLSERIAISKIYIYIYIHR